MNCKDYHGYVVWDNGTVIGKRLRKPLKSSFDKKTGYYKLRLWVNGGHHTTSLHTLVAKLFLPNIYGKPSVDHKDQNKTNNSLYNLRWATRSQQIHNTGVRSTNTSGVKGVGWSKDRFRWTAHMGINGKNLQKRFKTKEEAIAQRLEWEKIYH